MKRELQCTWTFWQDQWHQQPAKSYLAHLGDAANVKDFYVLLNRHTLVTVPMQSSLHIFRKHVKPEWEDPHNITGGHLRFFANTLPNETAEVANKRLGCLWFDILRSVIGEHMEHASSVVGVGYTMKPQHPIVSLWISTTDPNVTVGIRNSALQLFSPPANMSTAALFTARFYIHKKLASTQEAAGGHHARLEEVHTWHRRIQSAPQSHVTIGDEDEGVEMMTLEGSVASPDAAANSTSSLSNSASNSLLMRRGLNLPSPTRDHQRSKTASCTAEAMVSQPIKHVPLGAPSPVKDWSTAFTPSYIASAPPPAPLAFPPPEVPQPPRGLDVCTPSASEVPPPVAAPTASSGKQQHHKKKGATGPPLPISSTPTVESAKDAADAARDAVASDRQAFVFEGIVYPPKMNRKVYRAVVFSQNPEGTVVPGSFSAPPGTANGNISTEQYENWLAAASRPAA